jgi:hypothetical protein
MDNQNEDKNDENLNRQSDRPKEGERTHNSVNDADREKQQRERDEREREEKNKQANIQEPPKTKTATP